MAGHERGGLDALAQLARRRLPFVRENGPKPGENGGSFSHFTVQPARGRGSLKSASYGVEHTAGEMG